MSETAARSAGGISVVTPTLGRPMEAAGLLANLCGQSVLPVEVIVVDALNEEDSLTRDRISQIAPTLPFPCRYIHGARGTAIQRNAGIEAATGDFIAFIDDDIRLAAGFFESILAVFAEDRDNKVGGIVGYRTNQHFTFESAQRWRWYRRLRLLRTFEPGRYDFDCGYPINANLQEPFVGVREVDFLSTSCAVWRREVFDSGLRFDPFFSDYGVLEDAHFALRAGRRWTLLQSGGAHCVHLNSPNGRIDNWRLGRKCVVNYYYVFSTIVGPLSWAQQFRFWRFQAFELFRIGASGVRNRRPSDFAELCGRLGGIIAIAGGSAVERSEHDSSSRHLA